MKKIKYTEKKMEFLYSVKKINLMYFIDNCLNLLNFKYK